MGTLFRQTPNNGYPFPPKWPLKMGTGLAASAAHPRPNNIWVPPPPPPPGIHLNIIIQHRHQSSNIFKSCRHNVKQCFLNCESYSSFSILFSVNPLVIYKLSSIMFNIILCLSFKYKCSRRSNFLFICLSKYLDPSMFHSCLPLRLTSVHIYSTSVHIYSYDPLPCIIEFLLFYKGLSDLHCVFNYCPLLKNIYLSHMNHLVYAYHLDTYLSSWWCISFKI